MYLKAILEKIEKNIFGWQTPILWGSRGVYGMQTGLISIDLFLCQTLMLLAFLGLPGYFDFSVGLTEF